MKLIDLLVQELPKRGGWPEGVKQIGQDYDRELMFYGNGYSPKSEIFLDMLSSDHRIRHSYNGTRVTRAQYEAALQSGWNGEGLPPIGCEFEYGSHRTKAKCIAVSYHHVFASKGDPDDEDGEYEEFLIDIQSSSFHPLRTEAERKREGGIDAIYKYYFRDGRGSAAEIYDAIAAGKIPGVKLDD